MLLKYIINMYYDVFLLLKSFTLSHNLFNETMSGKHHSGISLLMKYYLHVTLRRIFALRISLYLIIFQPKLV